MKLAPSFLSLAALTAAFIVSPSNTQGSGNSLPPAKIFQAAPGTNTLMAARDAVRAWRTAGHSNEVAVIRLGRGEYLLTEPLALEKQDGNVTWVADNPDHTTISGGRRITNFTQDEAGIWRAKTGLHFEQLYVNHRRAARATSPGEGFFSIGGVKQDEQPDGKVRLTIKVPDAAITALTATEAGLRGVQILVYHKWDTSRYAVSSMHVADKIITVEGDKMQPWNSWDAQSRFILENCGAMPIQAGSWYLGQDDGVSYHPRPGEKIGSTEFVAPVIEKFLEIHGATDLHFKGFRFRHAGYQLPPEGCPPMQAAAKIEASIQIDDAQEVTFEDCDVAHTGNYGIWFRRGCRDCRIEHCLLEDLGAGGIRIGEMGIRDQPGEQTTGIIADNNIIRGCGRVHPSAVGVWIGQSANNRVTHNDISDTFYTGISVGWTWGYGRSLATNNFIGFNRVHNIGQGMLSDMGGIYTLGVSPGSLCTGNVFFDVRAHDYGGWGIYPDEGSTGWRIESNLVWNCTCVSPQTGGAFHQHYGATNHIANNIFAFSSGPPMQATRVEDHLSFTLEHNLIVSSNAAFFTGPWDKIQFQSRSNCFAYGGSPKQLFPNGDLTAWQKTGHEDGSVLTNLDFRGDWPDVALPVNSPAVAIGFNMFQPKQAGVYGERDWKRRAKETAGLR
ncbi:MAG: hypothetical protein JWR69_2269 [Pedosphaera sp.]|nr:hypothetical protein [Pedosphaera sp.]